MLGLEGKTGLRRIMRNSCRGGRGGDERGLDGFGSG
jgi:hypothetical protein